MNRITMSLENDFEGRVLASFDLDEFANKIRADAIDEVRNKMFSMPAFLTVDDVMRILDELKEQI